MDLSATDITILPGSKVRFEDCKTKEIHTVILKEEVTVSSVGNKTITVEENYGEEQEEEK